MIKNLRDLMPGAVVETRDNGFYIVLGDNMGRTALFNERGTWARLDDSTDLFFGTDKNTKEVVRIYGFAQTMPLLDQISESIKFIYDTRHNTAQLVKLWEVEADAVTEAKRELKRLNEEARTLGSQISHVYDFLNANK